MLTLSTQIGHETILICLLAIPLIAIAAMGVCQFKFAKYSWAVANLFSISLLVASIRLLDLFRADVQGFQFVVNKTLSSNLGIHFALGLDGIGVWCILFTSLIMAIAIYRAKEVPGNICGYLALLFLMAEATLGIFLALDLVLYYFFWELMLIPNFFLLYKFGQSQNKRAAIKLALFTSVGSLLMLISIVTLGQLGAFQGHSFFLGDLVGLKISADIEDYLLFGFLAAFFLKSAVFPFHSWLPDAHRAAPPGGSFDLTLVLPKVGLFGAIRLLGLLLPGALQRHQADLMLLGIIALFYGALVAWKETDLKRFLAYSTVSHVGLALAALSSLTTEGLTGCLFIMIGSAIATGSLFILISEMEKESGIREIRELGGLAKSKPKIAALFLIFGLSSIGLPLTNGFVGEFFSIAGIFKVDARLGILASIAVVFSALYMLSVYRHVFFGEQKTAGIDLNNPTLFTLLPALAFVFMLGLFPEPIAAGVRQSILALNSSSPLVLTNSSEAEGARMKLMTSLKKAPLRLSNIHPIERN
jgi:NADH-quinone oxidoreductase subunit M